MTHPGPRAGFSVGPFPLGEGYRPGRPLCWPGNQTSELNNLPIALGPWSTTGRKAEREPGGTA